MTTWAWKCRKCSYEFISPAFRFIPQCPKCLVEYTKLGAAFGTPSIGIMPIYALKTESIDNAFTNNSVLFAINTKANKIECYNKEFYQHVRTKFNELILEKNVKVVFIDIDK